VRDTGKQDAASGIPKIFLSDLFPGWPDVCETVAKKGTQPIFWLNQYVAFLWQAQKFGLLLKFSKNLPKVSNRPIGENSPNLVTLLETLCNTLYIISKATMLLQLKKKHWTHF
jgi:hypothetical protein